MEWFKLCKSEDEGKIHYRDLAKEFHPDLSNSDPEIMTEINLQYETFLIAIKNPIPEKVEIKNEIKKARKQKFKITFSEEQTETIKNHLVDTATIIANATFNTIASSFANKYINH